MTGTAYIEARLVAGTLSHRGLLARFVCLLEPDDLEDERCASAWRALTAAVDAGAADPVSRVLGAVDADTRAWLLELIEDVPSADSERPVIFARAAAVRFFSRARRRERASLQRRVAA